MKNILIYSNDGLGNKIFDAMISIYLKQTFGYNVLFSLTVDPHSIQSEKIDLIFKKLRSVINFISAEEGKLLSENGYQYMKIPENIKLSELEQYFLNTGDNIRIYTPSLYNKTFEIFDQIDQSLFDLNLDLIGTDVLNICKKRYGAIHIRYGDKIGNSVSKGKTNMRWPIFSPYFYFRQIKEMKKEGLTVFILTDSHSAVRHYILKKYNLLDDENIYLLDTSPIRSVYLLMNATYFVMSHSTFSYISYLLGKQLHKNKKIVIASVPNLSNYGTVDIQQSNDWTIWYGKKFILNFDVQLVFKIRKFLKLKDKLKS